MSPSYHGYYVGVGEATVPHTFRCPENSNVVQFKPTQLAPHSQPTLTHLTEICTSKCSPRSIMCQKITTTYRCGCTDVKWVKTSGCSGKKEKCPKVKAVQFTNNDDCERDSCPNREA